MKLHPPFQISSRLLPALLIGEAWVQLEYAKRISDDKRTCYKWTIDLKDGKTFSGDKLKSAVGGGNLQQGFNDLLSFLDAFVDGGDNAALFPKGLRNWALAHQYEIFDFAEIVEKESALIDED